MADVRFEVKDGRKPPWYRADNRIIDVYGGEMKPGGLAVYHALCRHANEQGECFPSHGLLARETGMSVTTVKKYIKLLCKLDLIKKEVRRYAKAGPRSNIYTLLEISDLRQNLPKAQAESAYALRQNPAMNKTNTKKTHRRISSTGVSLTAKRKALRDYGLKGPIVKEIAENRDMAWIQKAMTEMKNPSPGGIVYLYREEWGVLSEEDDAEVPLFCSKCANLEHVCFCPDPKPRRVVRSELTRLQERRRADALRSAANPDPDRLQRFSDVHKRFPDTPHELLEFEAGLNER